MKKTINEQAIRKFKKYLLKTEKSLSTIEKYIRDIRKLKKYIKEKTLTKQLLLEYKSQLEKLGEYKVSSMNSFIAAINSFCTAMNWKELCIKTIKVQRTAFETEEKELTMSEYRKMVSNALAQGQKETALIMQTIAGTGIRVSELKHINVECLEKGVVDVYNKGKVRRILLPSALQVVLKKYVEEENIEEGIIFQNRKKQPIDRREVWQRMKKAAEAADIPQSKVFPHNLRHLFAREFYKQTGDIAKLADVLGHSSIETTRIYIKSTGREHKRQLDMMDMILDSDDKNIQDKENKCVEDTYLNRRYSENENRVNIQTMKNKCKNINNSDDDIQHILNTHELTMTAQKNISPVYNSRTAYINDNDAVNADIQKTRSGIIIASESSLRRLPFVRNANLFRLLQKSNWK